MTLREDLGNFLNRFRSISINHPIAYRWRNGIMTYYQLGKKWNMSKLFHSCYMPRKSNGVLLPKDVKKLLLIEMELSDYKDNVIIVPKEFGFDLMKPTESGPVLLDEVRFYSIKNKLVMYLLNWIPSFKGVLKMVEMDNR